MVGRMTRHPPRSWMLGSPIEIRRSFFPIDGMRFSRAAVTPPIRQLLATAKTWRISGAASSDQIISPRNAFPALSTSRLLSMNSGHFDTRVQYGLRADAQRDYLSGLRKNELTSG